MKQTLLTLTFSLFLATIAFFCSKPRHVSPTPDSTKPASSAGPQNPHPVMTNPLPEADTTARVGNPMSFALRSSELWAVDTVSNRQIQLTFTQEKVHKFFTSPSNKYVACLHQIEITKEPGIFEEGKAPDRSIYSIMVFRSADLRLIREFASPPFFDPFLQFRHWISDSRFLCNTSDGFSIGSAFVYDAFRDSLQQVPEDYYWHSKRAPSPNKRQTGARTLDRQ